MVSKTITRTYYVLSGNGYFTIDDSRYDVRPGMLAEVPPKVEYSYSGRMTLIAFARPRWFSGNDRHYSLEPDVVRRDLSGSPAQSLGGHEWPGSGSSENPGRGYRRLNRWRWNRHGA